jgi:tRNA(Arg) A34 adenosine deaminase TadA
MPAVKIRKVLLWSVTIILILGIAFIIFSVQAYRIRKETKETPEVTATIRELGYLALENLDVPIGAVLLYKGEMIGKGYNRVLKDTNLAAHAEIEAMNDAVKRLGIAEFNKLDRNDLVMISSYEPCEMCRGAMVHHGIRKTVFLKDKPFSMWLKTYRRGLLYEFGKRKAKGEGLQDSLFHLHPDYPGNMK